MKLYNIPSAGKFLRIQVQGFRRKLQQGSPFIGQFRKFPPVQGAVLSHGIP